MPALFDILYNEALTNEQNVISPLKICTHKTTHVNDDTRLLFALYDYIHLTNLIVHTNCTQNISTISKLFHLYSLF